MARKSRRASPRGKNPKSSRSAGKPLLRFVRWLAVRLTLLLLVATFAYGAWLDLHVRSQFEGRRWQVPARIFGREVELYAGAAFNSAAVIEQLKLAGYHNDDRLSRPASYRQRGKASAKTLEIRTRDFQFWDGLEKERVVKLRFRGATVHAMEEGGKPAALVRLEPALIGRIYPTHGEDRVLVRLEEVPRSLVSALLAIEDRTFFEHHGVSLRGIARAAWANLRAAGAVQGGSTLTQQLAKSYFLTSDRTLWRKLNDMAIALILEARYSKEEILEAYLNEVYVGQDGPRAIHGYGLAAEHYFSRRLSELHVPEMALLAGLIKGPSYYNPRRHPQRAKERRDLVIEQMRKLGMIDDKWAAEASAAALGVSATPGDSRTDNPGFLDLVRRQLRRDYRDEDLRNEGLRIFSTLDPITQRAAQKALSDTVNTIESRRAKDAQGLQGAVVVTEPQSAEVLALVSGRRSQQGDFNRALDAQRPIGSLIKPVVYVSALAQPRKYTLATLIDDSPISVPAPRGEPWQPANYDGKSHGMVPLIDALARSYNLATVRLGLDIGVDTVRSTLAKMGITRKVNTFPSMLLGALELSPIEVTGLYQTFASGGFHQPLRAIRAVSTAQGEPLERYGLNVEEAIDPRANFLVVRAMQEVFSTGTARSARAAIPKGGVAAGKTGTTDELRDSWFAGFSGDRLAVVWLGRDDNRSAKLTGASGALKVWASLFANHPPRALLPTPPPGISFHRVDTQTGFVLNSACARAQQGSQWLQTTFAESEPLPFIEDALATGQDCAERDAADKSLFSWPWSTFGDDKSERSAPRDDSNESIRDIMRQNTEEGR